MARRAGVGPRRWLLPLGVWSGYLVLAQGLSILTASSVIWWGSEWSRFGGWWIGDALGGLVIAPLFLAFRTPTIRRSLTEIVSSGTPLVARS